ncbi:hypothetical protein HY993_01610 [Candidatus Micrarchaeota archaeon]|nr:hypothetical protein [Candidatus Micrarchaeota archaeon]
MVEYSQMVSSSFSYARKSVFTKLVFGYYVAALLLLLILVYAISQAVSQQALAAGQFSATDWASILIALAVLFAAWLGGIFLLVGQVIHANSFLDKKQLSPSNSLNAAKKVFLPALGVIISVALVQVMAGNLIGYARDSVSSNVILALFITLINLLVSLILSLVFIYTMYCAINGASVKNAIKQGYELFSKNKLTTLFALIISALIAAAIILLSLIPIGLFTALVLATSDYNALPVLIIIGLILSLIALAGIAFSMVFYQTFILSTYRTLSKGNRNATGKKK